jgi:hypothetical protein
MAYIGNTPADKFLTLAKQSFSTSATTSYTLDSAVSSTQDIALFINNVRQSPVDAYTVSGTALTLTSATAGTDEMYCVYLGKTVGTVNPPNDSVGLDQLSATGTASSSTYLRGDNSWATAGGDLSFGGDTFGADKTIGSNDAYALSIETNNAVGLKIDNAGHITMPLTSAFNARSAANQTVSTSDDTTVVLGTEVFDQNADFASNTFTAPVTGRYQLNGQVVATGIDDEYLYFRIVTSNRNYGGVHQVPSTSGAEYEMIATSCLADMDAGDTAFLQVNSETDTSFELRDGECQFSGNLAC